MEVTGRTFQPKHRSAGRENGRMELPGAEVDSTHAQPMGR